MIRMKLTWCARVVAVPVLLQLVCHLCGGMVLPQDDGVNEGNADGENFKFAESVIDENVLLEKHARFMEANMNMSMDPCENFYEYACGNWKNNKLITEQERGLTVLMSIEMKVYALFVQFLQNTSVMEEGTAETKARQLFASCISMSEDMSQGYKALLSSFSEPVLNENETLDWIKVNFHSKYVSPLLPITFNFTDQLMVGFEIEAPKAVLTDSSQTNFMLLYKAFKFENPEEVEKELKALMAFEEELIASVSRTKSEELTLGEFMDTHNSSEIDWTRFFDLVFNRTLEKSLRMYSSVGDLSRLNKFLLRSSEEVMLQYVKWREIIMFYHIWKGRWNAAVVDCLEITIKYLGSALAPWFIEKAFDEERRTDVLQLSKQLKDTFYSFLDDYKWLDSATRSEAKSKLGAMDVIVGYVDEWKHRYEFDHKYKDVHVTDNYWENCMNMEQYSLSSLRTNVGMSLSFLEVTMMQFSPFYIHFENTLFITNGILHLPLYHIKLPHSLKFGGIGTVIAHETFHGFGVLTTDYDHSGKKRNWWSEESLLNFKERYQCLESQYDKFIYHGVRTNGSYTLDENISDNSGTRLAYHTYLRFLNENPNLERADDKPLPGFDFNNKQLFFLKFAQNWCNGHSPEHNIINMAGDVHAYDEFRVLGTLMNMQEFSDEFNCALGTNMNPLRECVVW